MSERKGSRDKFSRIDSNRYFIKTNRGRRPRGGKRGDPTTKLHGGGRGGDLTVRKDEMWRRRSEAYNLGRYEKEKRNWANSTKKLKV